MVEKAVSCYKSGPTCSLAANLPKRSSLVVCEFRTADKERCKAMDGYVQNLDARCHGT